MMSYKPQSFRDLPPGAGISKEAQEKKRVRATGDIRAQRPIFDHDKCVKCKLCITLCPEGCIYEIEDGTVDASMTFCKGCGICAYECPVKAIEMVREESK